MTSTQIQRIYKLGAALDLVKNDELHTLVLGLTGQAHVSKLSAAEFKAVEHELLERIKLRQRTCPPISSKSPSRSGSGMTSGQQNKVWQLMYTLSSYDAQPSAASLGDRLSGIIKRQLRIDANARQPFKWLDYQQGGQLIETLKKYVSSAEQKAGRKDAQ